MHHLIHRFRFYLEIIALPVFLFLVIHLSGHGIMTLLETGDHEHEHAETMAGTASGIHDWIEIFFTVEVLSGMLLLLFFVWLWHRPVLKKWVPCSHVHCHHKLEVPHLLAIIALCLHFFPEAGVRHELLKNAFEGGMINTLALIGFAAHFLVDVIVAVLISSYWSTRRAQFLSFGSIALVWIIAFQAGQHIEELIPHMAEGVLFLVSAFLLSMFVHMPHRPPVCGKCE
ncbi:hypothetical protein K9L63_03305 [Candidatus Gracilibacteria bacterium]|nr:hypothetical protein [Candidatus Gracilibacteria bacterium]